MKLPLKDHQRQRIQAWLNRLTVVCGLAVLGLFAFAIGWPLSPTQHAQVRTATTLVLAAFVAQELVRLLIQERIKIFIRERWLELFLACAVALELFFGKRIIAWLGEYSPNLPASTLALAFLAGNQVTLLVLLGLRYLRGNRLFHSRALSPGQIFILSFGLVIILGTLLLKTPQATLAPLSWVDAFFVATSAVCVTGLSPIDISTTLSLQGQWILLGLIQVGGLGIMTLTYFFAYFAAGGVSLRSRIGLQDLLSEENLGHIGTTLGIIVGFTLVMEITGAFLIHAALASSPHPPDSLLFFSLFHSVSAFCNAGFSTLGPGLADPRLSTQTGFLSVIMFLIVVGGLGFPVVKNFWDYFSGRLRRTFRLTIEQPPRLSANSRIVLVTTALLIVVGTALIWLTEYGLGHGPAAGNSVFTALFHSITARTAGFNITPVSALMPATATIMMLLMFIGGSPASTAGGIKTSTLAVAVLALRRLMLGRSDIEAFQRRFSSELANRALAIVLVAAAFIAAVSTALSALHPEIPLSDLVFEAISAISTVGLTRDVTAQLSPEAKLIVAFAMFVGRVGVLTLVMGLIPRRQRSVFRYPETNIILS